MRRLLVLCLVAGIGSCSVDEGGGAPPPQNEQAALGGQFAARITSKSNTEALPVSLVATVAAAQKIAPSEAVRRLVDDAVAATSARDRGLDRAPPASWLLVAARARLTADRARRAALALGPPTDEEVRELSLRHWREVDRPPAVRVVHVVVRRPEPADPTQLARAKELATQLAATLHEAKSPEELLEKGKSFPHPKEIDVRAERLPPFTDDGYSIEGPDVFDETFAKAAHRLTSVGETSQLVETKYGWHVIRLVERVPEHRMPFESRRIAFSEEAYVLRARQALEASLAPIRDANQVRIEPSAEQLMRSVTSTE